MKRPHPNALANAAAALVAEAGMTSNAVYASQLRNVAEWLHATAVAAETERNVRAVARETGIPVTRLRAAVRAAN